MTESRWDILPAVNQQRLAELKMEIKTSEIITSLLIRRGIDTFEKAKDFFNPDLSKLHSPFLMKDMDKAVKRIQMAIEAQEKILIYGDYDVDGTTSVALMYSFLRPFFKSIEFYIPDRYKEGYGISDAGIDYLIANDFTLMITLDCGIKGVEKIAKAQENGIDIIVCDHHLPGRDKHPAFAVLNPKQLDCNYPFKELSGCGIGFKLASALCESLQLALEKAYEWLDLTAISTSCDIVPVVGENRTLLHAGIEKIRNNQTRPGILKITEGLKSPVNEHDLVFKIGPRINAAGRIYHAKEAVKLLLESDDNKLEAVYADIQKWNEQRQSLDKQTAEEAAQQIVSDPFYKTSVSNVVFSSGWSKGVIGIAASKLVEQFYKPCIVLTVSEGKAVGSARSIPHFDIYKALEKCDTLLEKYGGHMYAAGLTLDLKNVDAFKLAFDDAVKLMTTPELLVPKIEIDAEIDFSDLKPNFLSVLQRFAPYGPENMRPVFLSKNLKITDLSWLGKESNHLRLKLEDKHGFSFYAIGFFKDNLKPLFKQRVDYIDLVYSLTENYFNNQLTWQLDIKDLKPSPAS